MTCDHGDHIVCNECTKPAGDVAQVHLDQAQLHADDYNDKNYPDEREVLRLKEETMNEPQLSAEMEKRFDEMRLGDVYDHRNYPNGLISPRATSLVKHFLATALEEEREKVLSEVEKMAGDTYDGSDWHTGRHALVDELRAKLNQLKGSDER